MPRGEPGEIVVRGYNVMRGYFNDPEATDEAIDVDGWLHTGDIGVMDEAGNVTITDRLKDMYVSGGFNVYPAEVEAVLRRHPGRGPGGGDRRARPADGRGGSGPGGAGRRAGAGGAGGRADRLGPGAAGQLQGAPPGGGWWTPCRSTPAARCSSASCAEQYACTGEPPARPVRSQHQRRTGALHTNDDEYAKRGRGAMRGIVYTGDDVEVTDQLSVGDPGPPRSGWPSAPPGCATATCR